MAVFLSVVVAIPFLGGVLFGRFLVGHGLRQAILATRGNVSLLDAVHRRNSPDFRTTDILRVYPEAHGKEQFLDQVSWYPPHVPVAFLGTAPQEGRWANATINRFHFRDDRKEYGPKPPDEVRVFITGGSVAFGTGAPSQEQTVSALLETVLNGAAEPPGTSYRVVNAGVPGYASTHERLLIELRLEELQPDVIVMLSGGNDVHWAAGGFDVRNLRTYADAHFDDVISRAYGLAGLDAIGAPPVGGPVPLPLDVADRLSANVVRAALATRAMGARLVFALQPNVRTTRKALSPREQRLLANMPGGDLWDPCYQAIRERLSRRDDEFAFVDLSPAFAGASANEEWFIDSYHFGAQGNRALAESLAPVVLQACRYLRQGDRRDGDGRTERRSERDGDRAEPGTAEVDILPATPMVSRRSGAS